MLDETQPTPPHADTPEQLAPTAQPAGAGMVSPDGLWRWDGSTWVPAAAGPHAAAAGRAPVKDTRQLALWTVGAFGLVILSKIILLIAALGRLDIVNRALNGDIPTDTEATNSDDFVRLAAFLEIAAVVITAVVFLIWLHRLVANNHALALRRLRFSAGWAVGWWFIPFANLVMPYQVMVESWRATDPDAPQAEPYQPPTGRRPLLVVLWWLGLVIGYLIVRIISAETSGDGLQQLHDSTVWVIVATILSAVDAVLAVLIVLRLTGRQNALIAKLRRASAAA